MRLPKYSAPHLETFLLYQTVPKGGLCLGFTLFMLLGWCSVAGIVAIWCLHNKSVWDYNYQTTKCTLCIFHGISTSNSVYTLTLRSWSW